MTTYAALQTHAQMNRIFHGICAHNGCYCSNCLGLFFFIIKILFYTCWHISFTDIPEGKRWGQFNQRILVASKYYLSLLLDGQKNFLAKYPSFRWICPVGIIYVEGLIDSILVGKSFVMYTMTMIRNCYSIAPNVFKKCGRNMMLPHYTVSLQGIKDAEVSSVNS